MLFILHKVIFLSHHEHQKTFLIFQIIIILCLKNFHILILLLFSFLIIYLLIKFFITFYLILTFYFLTFIIINRIIILIIRLFNFVKLLDLHYLI